MDLRAILLIVIVMITPTVLSGHNLSSRGDCPNLRTSLGSVRKRRHLAFPTGSIASVTTSVVKTFMTHAPSGWYLVIEIEAVFKLPDAEFIAANTRKKLRHRQKREMWEIFQDSLKQRNINGRACIIRTICEAQMELAPKGKSLVHDILRAMFTAPLHEKEFVEEIGVSFDELLEEDFCKKQNDCPFSLLSFLLELNKER